MPQNISIYFCIPPLETRQPVLPIVRDKSLAVITRILQPSAKFSMYVLLTRLKPDPTQSGHFCAPTEPFSIKITSFVIGGSTLIVPRPRDFMDSMTNWGLLEMIRHNMGLMTNLNITKLPATHKRLMNPLQPTVNPKDSV